MTAEVDSSSGGPGGVVRHRGRRSLILVSASAMVVLAACSSGGSTASSSSSSASAAPVKGGTLNMLGTGDVDYMDPNLSYYTIGYEAARLYSRQPYTYSGDAANAGQTVPDMATALPTVSADGLTASFTIRTGIKWDTTPARQVTADDVIRGIKRTCNPAQPFGGLPDYQDVIVGFSQFCTGFGKVAQTAAAIAAYQNSNQVSGLKASGPGDLTLTIQLTHPASYLADMMTLTAFSAAPAEYDAYVPGSSQLAQHTISDGPYAITSYSPTKSIVFDRNPAWDPTTDPVRKAYVDKIVVDETSTQESVQQQLETGSPSADMEWDAFPPPQEVPALIAKKDPLLNLGATSNSNPYIVFNTISPNANGALGKLGVRQALEYGLNRTTMIQALGGPTQNPPLTHILPSSILGGTPNYDPYPHDVAKAKALLAAAGYPNGLTLKVLYRNSSIGSSKVFATLQQDLTAIGVTVQGVASPSADFYTKYLEVPSVAKRGVWDAAIAGWGADWNGNAALSYFNPLFSGASSYPPNGSNFGFYNSATTNADIQAAISAKTSAAAAAAWHVADQQVMSDAAIFPITNNLQANYHAAQVHNAVYVDQLQNFDAANVWLDPAKNGG